MKTATRQSSTKYLSRLPVLLHLLLFIFCAAPLPAQQPFHIKPVFRNYTTDDGLPSNETFAIQQDRQGYMWFSTNHGVCRFNGYEFDQFPDTLQANFSSVMSRCMMEDSCGRMWWADFNGRVFYCENGRIIPWKYNYVVDSLRSQFDFINGFIVGGCGEDVWLSSNNFGILHVDKSGKLSRVPKPERVADVRQVFEQGGGFIVVNVPPPPGLKFENYPPRYLYKSGHYSQPINLVPGGLIRMDYVGKLRKNKYLMGYYQDIFLFKDLAVQWQRQYDKEIVWLFEDNDGSLLLGQQRGGGVRHYASLEDLRKGNIAGSFLEGLSISIIFKDREGGYWFGSQERGLFYTPSLASGIVEGVSGMRADIGKGVVSDGAGHLYFGTQNGRLFDLDLQRQTARDITPGTVNHIFTLYFDDVNQMLLCSGLNMAFYQKGKWRKDKIVWPYYSKKGFATASSRVARTDNPDYLWLSSFTALSLIDWKNRRGIETTGITLNKRMRFNAVSLDATGRVWTSTNTGMQEYRERQLLLPKEKHPAFLQPAYDMQLLADSSLVFCPRGYGVAFWKPGSGKPPQVIGEAQGLIFNKVDRLYQEPGGAIWACTERGASRISPDRQHIENFTVKTGLPSNRVSQVALAGGWYWLATGGGLFRMAGKLPKAPMPPPLLEAIDVYGVRYPAGSLIRLPHDSSSIRIEWVALHYRSNGDIAYRYRLSTGNDAPNWTKTTDRQVNFSKLLPGSYRFEVQAQDESGAWGEAIAQEFIIRPAWWATWWARSTAGLLIGLLAIAAYRYRTNQIRTESRLKEEMLQLERSALQAQMNPHFIFNCLNSIQHFILENDADSAVLYLARFAKLVRSNLQVSVAGSVRLEEEVQMLDHYLALERLRFKQLFDYTIEVDKRLDRVNTHLPPLVVQPFVENAVLHGMKGRERGGLIKIVFGREDGYLHVTVLDNGSGVQSRSNEIGKPSLGRSITQRRLELLSRQTADKTVSVQYLEPADGFGTIVRIRLPQAV
ncbi:MAG: histidine kinase [Lewinellaceae bacterium]|nr:histidine kinase [Lewinellaceae bacterium]